MGPGINGLFRHILEVDILMFSILDPTMFRVDSLSTAAKIGLS